MRLVLDESATDGAVNPPIVQYGTNPKLFAQLVFNVDYDTAVRRRRRQVSIIACTYPRFFAVAWDVLPLCMPVPR